MESSNNLYSSSRMAVANAYRRNQLNQGWRRTQRRKSLGEVLFWLVLFLTIASFGTMLYLTTKWYTRQPGILLLSWWGWAICVILSWWYVAVKVLKLGS